MAKHWREAKSITVMKRQINSTFPFRDKKSDGTVGDLRHQKSTSDHNPNEAGVVRAWDITLDTNPKDGEGVNCHILWKILLKNRDKRIKYLIFNGLITTLGKDGRIEGFKKYTGTNNPHKHHLHISVKNDPALYDSELVWNLDGLKETIALVGEAKADLSEGKFYVVKKGDILGKILKAHGLSIEEFYRLNKLTADAFDPDNIFPGESYRIK